MTLKAGTGKRLVEMGVMSSSTESDEEDYDTRIATLRGDSKLKRKSTKETPRPSRNLKTS